MGIVYHAEDLKLSRQFAIKFREPPNDATAVYSEVALRRFEREPIVTLRELRAQQRLRV